jgi:16S rRNA C967 or C1407 C5-methylase (RsmB/RsmF family)
LGTLETEVFGHVVAVDGSTARLAQLRHRLAGVGPDRLTTLHADLTSPLALEEPVDAVFAVATLHPFRLGSASRSSGRGGSTA